MERNEAINIIGTRVDDFENADRAVCLMLDWMRKLRMTHDDRKIISKFERLYNQTIMDAAKVIDSSL